MQILNRSKVDNHTADIAAAKNLYSMHVFFPTFLVWDLMTLPHSQCPDCSINCISYTLFLKWVNFYDYDYSPPLGVENVKIRGNSDIIRGPPTTLFRPLKILTNLHKRRVR